MYLGIGLVVLSDSKLVLQKTLVTGARGDIGSLLIGAYHANGQSLIPLDEKSTVTAARILHLAAKSPGASVREYVHSNLLYLQNVIMYAKRNCIEELIFFSSASVYGRQDREEIVEEEVGTNLSLYGSSKLFGEEILRESGLKVCSIRLPAILGHRGTKNFVARIYEKLLLGEEIVLTNAHKYYNSFLSVENLFEFLAKVELKKGFDVINLACQNTMTLLELVELMREALDSHSRVVISSASTGLLSISTSKAEREYGFKPHDPSSTLLRWMKKMSAL